MRDKRLTRSTSNRILGGVAAGVAEYFDLDPTLVRVLWVVAVIFAGFGVLAYVILWVFLPEDHAGGSYALAIAEERYARGDITAEEFRSLKEDLQAR